MTFKRFEELPAWKAAMDLGVRIYEITKNRAFRGPGDLRSQLRRAALSVSNNIAEGFERGTTAELLTFLYIARGSAGEVRSMLHFVERLIGEREAKGRVSEVADHRRGDRQRVKTSQGRTSVSGSKRPVGNTHPASARPYPSNVSSEISDFKSEISDSSTEVSGFRAEIGELKELAESCSRQLRAWADSLQNSDIKGQRHLTERSKNVFEQQKRADAFWERVEAAANANLAKSLSQ